MLNMEKMTKNGEKKSLVTFSVKRIMRISQFCLRALSATISHTSYGKLRLNHNTA